MEEINGNINMNENNNNINMNENNNNINMDEINNNINMDETNTNINNEEFPIGFTMELAQHSDILNQFSTLPETEKRNIIDGAKLVGSRDEMRNYVENMCFKN